MVKVARSLPLAYKNFSAVEFVYHQNQGWSKHLINIFLSYRQDNESVFFGVFGVGLWFVLIEQTNILDAEFKYLIIFFNLSKINFAKLKQK